MAGTKIGRNTPCPCGSGKKYKKCCGKSPTSAVTPNGVPPANQAAPPDDPHIESVSKIEIAKALKAIQAIVTPSDYEHVRNIILPTGTDTEATERAIAGLAEEDEFGLLCRLMGTSTHLIHLEQRPLIHGDFIVPDFLARFQPGYSLKGISSSMSSGFSCLIDVKSTEKDKYTIRGGLLTRRRNFAKTFNLPLFFAVRFTRFPQSATWVIVEDAAPNQPRITITASHLIDGVRHVLWDDYFYMLMPGTYFQSTFSKATTSDGVRHHKYGRQVFFDLVNGKQRERFSGAEAFMFRAFLDGFSLREIQSQVDGELTYVIYVPEIRFLALADAVYRINRIARGNANTFSATSVIQRLDQKNPPFLIPRQVVENIGASIARRNFLMYISFGDEARHLSKWKEFGGKE